MGDSAIAAAKDDERHRPLSAQQTRDARGPGALRPGRGMSRGGRIHAEPDQNASGCDLLTPPERWTSPEPVADAPGAEGNSDIDERVERHADRTEDQNLYGQGPVLRLAELRQERQEE